MWLRAGNGEQGYHAYKINIHTTLLSDIAGYAEQRERERGESTHHVLHTTRLASPVRVYGCRAEGMPVGVHHLGTGWAQFPGAAFLDEV